MTNGDKSEAMEMSEVVDTSQKGQEMEMEAKVMSRP